MDWSEIWYSLGENLMWVCLMFGLFALCVIANIIAGIYYHVRHIGQRWNSTQLLTSILRMLAIGLSTAILAVVATVAPLVLSHFELMNKDFSKLVSISLIIGMYVRGIVKYFKEALDTVDNILANRDVVGELQTIPPAEPDETESGPVESDSAESGAVESGPDESGSLKPDSAESGPDESDSVKPD